MKHGKRPTIKQSLFIESYGLDASDWLVCKDTPELMELVNRVTGYITVLAKGGDSTYEINRNCQAGG